MESTPTSLDEMFSENDLIFVDGSVKGRNGAGFFKYFYNSRHFEDLKIEPMRLELEDNSLFLRVMRNPKCFTVSGVVDEVKVYANLLGDKITFLSQLAKNDESKPGRKKNRRRLNRKGDNQTDKKKALLRTLQEMCYESYTLCKSKQFNFDDIRYGFLVEMVYLIDRAIGIKKDEGYSFGHHKTPNTDSDTDDNLVAAVYYTCAVLNKPVSILTSDYDIPRLLDTTAPLLGADEFLPYNHDFRNGLNINGFNLYMFDGHVIEKFSYGFSIGFCEKFALSDVGVEKAEETREEVSALWKKFSEGYT